MNEDDKMASIYIVIAVWAVVTIVLIFEFGKTPLERLNFFVGSGIGLIIYFVGVAVSIYTSQLRKEKQIRERIRSTAKVKQHTDEYYENKRVGRRRALWYKFLYFFRRGQKEYCVQCLPVHAPPYYPYWLINTRRATLKPIGDCKHN